MGNGVFSYTAYEKLSVAMDYRSKSRDQIFTAREIDPDMDPGKITVRESRDSGEHPESLSIIVGLDVTGSMGFIPEQIVKESLPELVGTIVDAGIPDPQVLFLGIGDFVYDRAPLQVGQFESSAELLDRWLTRVYLEGGGGGNNFEGYNLAWLLAARHTSIDCLEKRGEKGLLFTIGDEPNAREIPGEIISRLTNEPDARSISSRELLEEVSKKYEVFHLHIEHDELSAQDIRKGDWKELLGQRFICLDDHKKIARTIAQLAIDTHKKNASRGVEEKPVENML